MPPSPISGSGLAQLNLTASASARVIANFAWQHLKAATTFRDQTRSLELVHAGSGLGPHFEDIRSYASACITSAASSLEALINEFFIAPNCKLRAKFADFEREFWAAYGIERKPVLAKYQHALDLLGIPRLPTNTTTYQDTKALLELRNSLVHYKPTWEPDRPGKATLTAYLQGKYPISPFLSGNEDFTTMQSMSSGCCNWAVKTAFAFIRDFDGVARLDNDKMKGFWKIET